ncbi:unnamed protein product, partial [marine sediment metagenome]
CGGESPITVTYKGAPIITMKHPFWAANWSWAGATVHTKSLGDGKYSMYGESRKLGLAIRGAASAKSDHVFEVRYKLVAARELKNIIGGGIEFRLDLKSDALPKSLAKPELLGDERGWRWSVAKDQALTVRFDPPVAKVYFERNNPSTIRVMLVGESLAAGPHEVTMTIELPKGGTMARSAAERYGPADVDNWLPNALSWATTPVDVSFLNHKPAGRHGFIRAE